MGADERTGIGLAITLVVLALLAAAQVLPLWSVEHSTGRQVAPNGIDGEDGIERREIAFYATGWQGDMAPADPAAADEALRTILISTYVTAGALAIYVLGQIPGVSRVVTRRWCMALAGIATCAVTTGLVGAWAVLPDSMAAMGIQGPFTSLLLEDGYIRSHLDVGWVAGALAAVGSLGALMSAYSAGNADPRTIEQYGARA